MFSFSPTLEQGVTTHLAAVHNSQTSHFTSTSTDLVWGAMSKVFRKVIMVHVATAHSSTGWQSLPQTGSESLEVMQSWSGTKQKITMMEQYMNTWFYFLFTVTNTLKTASCASILSSKRCQENKNKWSWTWTTHTPLVNKQSVFGISEVTCIWLSNIQKKKKSSLRLALI